MAHGDEGRGKWRGNWRTEWVASTFHTTSEHGVSSITTADAHTSAASSRLNWRPCRFKWTRPFRRKTKSGFCACAITFQTQSTKLDTQREICRSGCLYSMEVGYSVRHGGMCVLMFLQRAAKEFCVPHSIRQSLPPFSLQSVILYGIRFRCVLRTLRMEFLITYKIWNLQIQTNN